MFTMRKKVATIKLNIAAFLLEDPDGAEQLMQVLRKPIRGIQLKAHPIQAQVGSPPYGSSAQMMTCWFVSGAGRVLGGICDGYT